MKKLIVLIIVIVSLFYGCEYSSSYSSSNYYIGVSLYVKKTRGTSNLVHGYKEPPVLDVNNPLAKLKLENSVQDYLDGIVNDLKEIKEKADNANEKKNVLVDAALYGFEYFQWYFRYVGSVTLIKRKSNFDISGYPEFSDFHYPKFFPVKPSEPLYLNDDFAVESYNNSVRKYNREVADLAATVKDYIEDAKHYIENSKNDYELIRKKGLYVESLSINPKVSSYYAELERDNADYKKVTEPNTTSKNEVESMSGSTNSGIPQQSIPQETQIDDSGRKIKGYRATIDAKTGKPVITPVYKDDEKK
ncbi:MAG: hypothetical protein JXA96_14925 [Sedimentisphaerales bacterium]|nr:hypothetical protein [Sedimentisphaerales bacterium]